MRLHSLPYEDSFDDFSQLYLNSEGHYVEPGSDLDYFSDGAPVGVEDLPAFLKQKILLPKEVTDVFVWVHGWQNEHPWALACARRMFAAIQRLGGDGGNRYPSLDPFVPWFVSVRWPCLSSPLPAGYRKIRDRASQLTERGDAAFFLASLLGYLDEKNSRAGGPGSKTLWAKGGFAVHCLAHSFGGRFVTAAVSAAAEPGARTRALLSKIGRANRKLLSARPGANGFEFTVDSMLVFQMAAPRSRFESKLEHLIDKGPLRGPVVLTYSKHDRANCIWHRATEGGETAIGCSGAVKPKDRLTTIKFGDLEHDYSGDFTSKIVNVNASAAFANSGFRVEGAHSDFWYEESIHLILSLVNFVRQ
jgi:hypothetical protein